MMFTRNKTKPDQLVCAGGSGDVLLAALITRPQSESQIGARKRKLYVKSKAWVWRVMALSVFCQDKRPGKSQLRWQKDHGGQGWQLIEACLQATPYLN